MTCTADDFDLLRIREETFVQSIDFHWVIESTNTRAADVAIDPHAVVPALVLAQRQTRGRGRGNNVWIAGAGALTFSVVISLDSISKERIPQVSLAAGLAVCRTIERLLPAADVGLKWPNDVYLTNRKVAGILIELPHSTPPRCVVGIGLNANNSVDPALIDKATTLHETFGRRVSLTDVLITCLKELEQSIAELQNNAFRQAEAWRAYDFLCGRQIIVDAYGETLVGVAAGIEHSGALRLETAQGRRTCMGGVVREIQ